MFSSFTGRPAEPIPWMRYAGAAGDGEGAAVATAVDGWGEHATAIRQSAAHSARALLRNRLVTAHPEHQSHHRPPHQENERRDQIDAVLESGSGESGDEAGEQEPPFAIARPDGPRRVARRAD